MTSPGEELTMKSWKQWWEILGFDKMKMRLRKPNKIGSTIGG